jgi:hypothetical protein
MASLRFKTLVDCLQLVSMAELALLDLQEV